MWGVGFGVPSHVRLSLTWWQDAWVAPTGHLGAPFNQQKEGCGALSTLTEEQVAVRLLSLTKRLSGPCKVVFEESFHLAVSWRLLAVAWRLPAPSGSWPLPHLPPSAAWRGRSGRADGRAWPRPQG